LKEKSNPAEKEVQEGSGLKTAGPEGEITAGVLGYGISVKMFSSTMGPVYNC